MDLQRTLADIALGPLQTAAPCSPTWTNCARRRGR